MGYTWHRTSPPQKRGEMQSRLRACSGYSLTIPYPFTGPHGKENKMPSVTTGKEGAALGCLLLGSVQDKENVLWHRGQ